MGRKRKRSTQRREERAPKSLRVDLKRPKQKIPRIRAQPNNISNGPGLELFVHPKVGIHDTRSGLCCRLTIADVNVWHLLLMSIGHRRCGLRCEEVEALWNKIKDDKNLPVKMKEFIGANFEDSFNHCDVLKHKIIKINVTELERKTEKRILRGTYTLTMAEKSLEKLNEKVNKAMEEKMSVAIRNIKLENPTVYIERRGYSYNLNRDPNAHEFIEKMHDRRNGHLLGLPTVLGAFGNSFKPLEKIETATTLKTAKAKGMDWVKEIDMFDDSDAPEEYETKPETVEEMLFEENKLIVKRKIARFAKLLHKELVKVPKEEKYCNCDGDVCTNYDRDTDWRNFDKGLDFDELMAKVQKTCWFAHRRQAAEQHYDSYRLALSYLQRVHEEMTRVRSIYMRGHGIALEKKSKIMQIKIEVNRKFRNFNDKPNELIDVEVKQGVFEKRNRNYFRELMPHSTFMSSEHFYTKGAIGIMESEVPILPSADPLELIDMNKLPIREAIESTADKELKEVLQEAFIPEGKINKLRPSMAKEETVDRLTAKLQKISLKRPQYDVIVKPEDGFWKGGFVSRGSSDNEDSETEGEQNDIEIGVPDRFQIVDRSIAGEENAGASGSSNDDAPVAYILPEVGTMLIDNKKLERIMSNLNNTSYSFPLPYYWVGRVKKRAQFYEYFMLWKHMIEVMDCGPLLVSNSSTVRYYTKFVKIIVHPKNLLQGMAIVLQKKSQERYEIIVDSKIDIKEYIINNTEANTQITFEKKLQYEPLTLWPSQLWHKDLGLESTNHLLALVFYRSYNKIKEVSEANGLRIFNETVELEIDARKKSLGIEELHRFPKQMQALTKSTDLT